MDFQSLKETQRAIKLIKDYFETNLADKLNLMRVSAPLFVEAESGVNDDLTGVEKPVSFEISKYNERVEIVQSLAKWKRLALKWYGFNIGEGIYADMDAIRPHEILDCTHSIYVDQWDWEKIINKSDRSETYLEDIVNIIYGVFKDTEAYLNKLYPGKYKRKLPENIFFIDTDELYEMYKDLKPEEREYEITKKHKAVFIKKIGHKLSDGKPHGDRSPDYDDWNLNGDIIFWNPVTESHLELSSMGVRVDEKTLIEQLELSSTQERKHFDYHRKLIDGELPYTIGGGIGQSRICMYFLEKKHIGEVQASFWPRAVELECKENGINLL